MEGLVLVLAAPNIPTDSEITEARMVLLISGSISPQIIPMCPVSRYRKHGY